MKVHVHLEFADAGQAADALARLRGDTVQGALAAALAPPPAVAVSTVIAPEDNPAAGFPPEAPAAPVAVAPTVLGFGQGVALPPGATPALPAAAAAAPLNVPAAPSGIAVPASPAPAVPTAPAAIAPPAPAALTPPAPGAATLELDSKGLPWDARIHASTQTKNADKSWRDKRNTPPEYKAQIEAELRSALALNAAAVLQAQAHAPQAQPAAQPAQQAAVPLPPSAQVAAAPVPPAPQSAAAGSAPAASPTSWTFPKLMEALAPKLMTQQLSAETVTATLARHGLTALGQVALTPDLIPAVAADFGL